VPDNPRPSPSASAAQREQSQAKRSETAARGQRGADGCAGGALRLTPARRRRALQIGRAGVQSRPVIRQAALVLEHELKVALDTRIDITGELERPARIDPVIDIRRELSRR